MSVETKEKRSFTVIINNGPEEINPHPDPKDPNDALSRLYMREINKRNEELDKLNHNVLFAHHNRRRSKRESHYVEMQLDPKREKLANEILALRGKSNSFEIKTIKRKDGVVSGFEVTEKSN
jgi:hypothetical protein